MEYMLLLTFVPGTGPQEGTPEYDAEMKVWSELTEELKRTGAFVAASGLQGVESATTLRTRGGEVVLTDGPYAETKEVLFSFYIVEAPDLDAATAWARRMPSAEYGAIEIRPLCGPEHA